MSRFNTRVPEGMGRLDQDLTFAPVDFVGATNQLGAAGGGTEKKSLFVTADSVSHLLVVGASFVCTDVTQAAAHVALPFMTIGFKLTSSNVEISESDVHLLTVAGTGQLPCEWPRPKLIAANSKMKVTVTNLEATARALRITFYCSRILLGDKVAGN